MLCKICGHPESSHGTFVDLSMKRLGFEYEFYCQDCEDEPEDDIKECPGFNKIMLDEEYVKGVKGGSKITDKEGK